MPVSSNNKFSRARRHLRSTQIDEKLQLLNEIPTNNTSSYYTIEPDVVTVTPAVRAEFDLTADDPALLGKDTSGLFDGNGAVLTQQPPGDTSYILGPMVSVYFPDGDYSAIGYIQKDTRKVINLARIPGTVSEWGIGGNVEGFTSYSQLTLEQALWYRDQLIAGDTTPYRVFYIGVFEQILSDPGVTDPSAGIDIDAFGRWLGQIINLGYEIEPEKIEVTPGQKGPDPNLPPGSANPFKGTGMAMIGALDSDVSIALLAGLVSGAVWAIDFIRKIGVDAWEAIQVLQSKTGEYPSGGPDTDNPYQRELQKKAREQSLPKEKSYERSDSPEKKAEREAADQKIRDAEQEVKDAESSGNKDRIDRAYDNYENAVKNRQRVREKQKIDRKAQERASGMPENVLLSKSILIEKRQRILRDLKKPLDLPKTKKEKIKHRPKVIKPNDCGTRVVGADLMKQAEVPTSFKRIEDTMWKKQERAQNTRFSQERKNMILDSVGSADHAWEWMTDKSKKKNEKSVYENFGPKNSANEDLKNRIISKKQVGNDSIIKMYNENGEIEIITQSVLNERLQKEYELQLKEQETLNAPNDPLVKRIKNKLYTQIDYPDKPAKMGYPNELPLPLGQDGYHIQYGDRADYYNRLDRHSADTMSNPLTGNEKIDAKVLDQTTSAKVNKLITKMRDKKKQSKINSSLENQ